MIYLHDFNILAVGAAWRQLHILNGFRVDELRMSANALAQAFQRGGGVVPGGVEEQWRCGTNRHGLWAWW